MANPVISIGRIVHYTLPEGKSKGQIRPAIVVRVWTGVDHPSVPLQVFTDSDGGEYNDALPQVLWKTSVMESQSGSSEFGRWHWPARG